MSVIVPCYNQGHCLPTALDSIATASIHTDEVEVIVVDDGSNDPSTKRLISELTRGPRGNEIKVIVQEHAGVSRARNAGARSSSGDYVIFLEADGMLTEGTIDVRLTKAAHKSADVIVTDYRLCNEQQNSHWRPERPTISQDDLNFRSISRCWERGVFVPIQAGLFRRDLVMRLPFDEALKGKQDWVFWMQLILLASRPVFAPKIGCVRRIYTKSVGNRDNLGMAVAWLDAAMAATRQIPQFGKIEQELALNHVRSVLLHHFWEEYRSAMPERFYGALFDKSRDEMKIER